MTEKLKAPFPWFGGKSRVADIVWDRLGDVNNYAEPFFGSGAVLLGRPSDHAGATETVNDIDGFVCNFWRAVQADPEAVADFADYPVNEIDLEARHRWLCKQPKKTEFLDRMKHDQEYFDVKRAGLWVWGLCAWIGSGWCGGEYFPEDHEASRGRGVRKVAMQRPHLGNGCQGVHRKRPHLGNGGQGVHRKRPHLGNCGKGVHRKNIALVGWMQNLAARLRRVRVCCGDWKRIITDGALAHGTIKGVFLDPPYTAEAGREESLYRCEDLSIGHAVAKWAIENGDRKNFRIALCGYEGEYEIPESWECVEWKAHGGYANGKEGKGTANKHRERIWFSPHCIRKDKRGGLFEGVTQ